MKNKTSDVAIKKLDRIVNDAIYELRDRLIYLESDGSYNLFDTYIIKQNSGMSDVFNKSGNHIHSFCSIKNAVAWCVFDSRNKFYDGRRIIDLDRQLASIDIDILIHKRMCSKAKSDAREIFELKLHEDNIKKKTVLAALKTYIDTSHNWQINRFNNKQ